MRLSPLAAPLALATTQALLYATFAAAYWLHDHVWGPLGAILGMFFGLGSLFVGALTAYFLLRGPDGEWRESTVPVPVVLAGIVLAMPIVAYGRALYPIAVCETSAHTLASDVQRCEILCTEHWSSAGTPDTSYNVSSGRGSSRTTHSYRVQALAPQAPDDRYVVWFEGQAREGGRCVWWERDPTADEAVRRHPAGHPAAIVGEWVDDGEAAVRWFRTEVAIFVGLVNLAALVAAALIGRSERRQA